MTRALTLNGQHPQTLDGLEYARMLAGLARFTQLLPEAERPAFARRWAPLAGEVRMLFSRYDGTAIPRYIRKDKGYTAEESPDIRLQGYLASAYTLVHTVDSALDKDETLLKDVRAWGTGEPVKLLNQAMSAAYSHGRFFDGGRVTTASMGTGLQHVDTLWQAYRVAAREHRKQMRRDRLWRFLGYTPPETLDLAREVDRSLAHYWTESRRSYAFEDGPVVALADVARLIAGHCALAGLYRLNGQKEAAEKVAGRQRQLIETLIRHGQTLTGSGLPAHVRFVDDGALAEGDMVDVAANFQLLEALADSFNLLGAELRSSLRQDFIDPLLILAETEWLRSTGISGTADWRGRNPPGEASLGSTGAFLSAVAAYYTGEGHPPLAPERMLNLKRMAGRLLASWDRASAVKALIPHPRPVVQSTSPPDWLLLALMVMALGAILYLALRFWPQRWNQAVPALGGMVILAMLISGFVGGTMKLAEYTSRSEFCASCHVIAPKVNDMFNPKSRSLAAKHYWHEWIRGNTLECYSCHTYGEGVRGVIATKWHGTIEVAETLFHLYEEPIRPRQDLNATCMQCHWRTLDPKYINDPYHLLFHYQLATSQMQCSACHVFHPRAEDVKGEHFRPPMVYRSES